MKITVNGETIPAEVYQHELQNLKKNNPGIPDEMATEQVQKHIIEWVIIRQAALKANPAIGSGEIDAEFNKLCQTHGGKDAFFSRFGMTDKDEVRVKNDIEQNLKTQRFIDQLTEDAAVPTEAGITEFYEQNRSHFIKPEQVHALHIVKQPKNEQDAIKLEQELREARQKLLAGADFLDLAAKVSDAGDHPADLGLFTRGQMTPAFEFVVFSMNVGEVSPVFQTQFGLHIAKVLDKKEPSQLSLDECKDEIRGRLIQGYKNTIIGNWVKEQRETADIAVQEA